MPLFVDGPAKDDLYSTLKNDTSNRAIAAKEYLEELFLRVGPYLESALPRYFRDHFQQMYWEMHLAAALLDCEVQLIDRDHRSGDGPDLLAVIDGKRYWFEAIAVEPGTGKDKVSYPEFDPNAPPVVRDVQDGPVTLRLTSGIDTKFRVYEDYLKKNKVAPNDGYIIALNSHLLGSDALLEATVPRIVKSVLPFGHEVVHLNKETLQATGYSHRHRPEVKKINGTRIPTTLFEDGKYRGLTAVLSSWNSLFTDYWCYPGFDNQMPPKPKPGQSFILVHNPLAQVPLPLGAIKRGWEYHCDSANLSMTDWNKRTSCMSETTSRGEAGRNSS